MANEIAKLFASLSFKVDDRGLKKFRDDLGDLENKLGGKGVGGAAEETGSKVNETFKRLKADYTTKVKPSLQQMKNDLEDVGKLLGENEITSEQYEKYRKRIVEEIGKKEKQIEVAHQRALKERATEQKQHDKARESALKKLKDRLTGIEKKYDKENFKLKEIRQNVRFINEAYRRGDVTLEHRQRQVRQLAAEYRRLQAAQASTAAGPYVGGKDPRQVGNHRIISAIHSDVGLGAIAGTFAVAQSSRAYQEFVGMEQGLAAAMGSMEKGQQEVAWLIQLSNKLGISLREAAEGYKTFAASTRGTDLAGQQTREIFESVSSYAKVLNLSADDQRGVFRALTQLVSKGVVQAEELRGQLGERLPGAYQAAARAMGMTTAELAKATENGEVVAEDLLPKLSVELMEMANQGDQLAEAINNTGAAFNRFGNNVWLTNRTINEAGLDKTVREMLNTMSDSLMKAEPLWNLLGQASEFFGRALETPIELLGTVSEKLGYFTDESGKANANFNLLVAAFAAASKKFRRFLGVFWIFPGALSAINDTLQNGISGWDDFFSKMFYWTTSALMLAGALRSVGKAAGVLKGGSVVGGAARGAGIGALLARTPGPMQVAVVSFIGISSLAAFGAMLINAFKDPSSATGQTISERREGLGITPENQRSLSDNLNEMKDDLAGVWDWMKGIGDSSQPRSSLNPMGRPTGVSTQEESPIIQSIIDKIGGGVESYEEFLYKRAPTDLPVGLMNRNAQVMNQYMVDRVEISVEGYQEDPDDLATRVYDKFWDTVRETSVNSPTTER